MLPFGSSSPPLAPQWSIAHEGRYRVGVPSSSSSPALSSLCRVQDTSPLPSPLPRTKSRKHTRALQKLRCQGQGARWGREGQFGRCRPLSDPESFLHPREVSKRLQDLRSCLSPKQRQGQDHQNQEDEVVLVEGPTLPESPRLFPLKIRCRADVVRLPVRMASAWRACGRRSPRAVGGASTVGGHSFTHPASAPPGPPTPCLWFAFPFIPMVFSSTSLLRQTAHPPFSAPHKHPERLGLVAPPSFLPLDPVLPTSTCFDGSLPHTGVTHSLGAPSAPW